MKTAFIAMAAALAQDQLSQNQLEPDQLAPDMLAQGLLKRSLIADIAIDHGDGASCDLLHTANSFRMAVAEVVENHDVMAFA